MSNDLIESLGENERVFKRFVYQIVKTSRSKMDNSEIDLEWL